MSDQFNVRSIQCPINSMPDQLGDAECGAGTAFAAGRITRTGRRSRTTGSRIAPNHARGSIANSNGKARTRPQPSAPSRPLNASLNGALGVPLALARASAPWVMGVLWSAEAGYRWGLGVMSILGVVAILSLWWAQGHALRQASHNA